MKCQRKVFVLKNMFQKYRNRKNLEMFQKYCNRNNLESSEIQLLSNYDIHHVNFKRQDRLKS